MKSAINKCFNLSGEGLKDLNAGVHEEVTHYHAYVRALLHTLPPKPHCCPSLLVHRILRSPTATEQEKDRAERMLADLRSYDIKKTAMWVAFLMFLLFCIVLIVSRALGLVAPKAVGLSRK